MEAPLCDLVIQLTDEYQKNTGQVVPETVYKKWTEPPGGRLWSQG